MSFEVLSTEWTLQSGKIGRINGSWDKKGVIIAPTEEWEKEMIKNFPSTIMSFDAFTRFYYYTCSPQGYNNYNLALAEIDNKGKVEKFLLEREPRGYFTLTGLPDGWHPIQPNVIRLSDKLYRMYFWAHGKDICRLLIAESENGMNWYVKNPQNGILYHHYNDIEARNGNIPPEKIANDATTVYRKSDGSFEMYSAKVIFVPENDPHYIAHDLSEGAVRFVQRWESADGMNWNLPEIILMPDESDPPDLQFYYLSTAKIPGRTLGIAGYYTAQNQIMQMELMHSLDGRRWVRHKRGGGFPLEDDFEKYGLYAPHNLIESNGKLIMYYSGSNSTHNKQLCSGDKPEYLIAQAEINIHKIFGCKISGTILSPPLSAAKYPLRLYLDNTRELKVEWCDAFGTVLCQASSPEEFGKADFLQLKIPAELQYKTLRIRLSGSFDLYNLCLNKFEEIL